MGICDAWKLENVFCAECLIFDPSCANRFECRGEAKVFLFL